MQVEIDNDSGFCFGVVNAISKAQEHISAGDKVVSLGDIVHNGAEVARLEALGLETAPEDAPLASLAARKVLIRAHGEPPSTYSEAQRLGITLIDATCPVVARLQKRVREAHEKMTRDGGTVAIFGKRGHAEVRGLVGAAGGEAVVVESEKDLDEIDFARPVSLLAQTTGSLSHFQKVCDEALARATIARNSSGLSVHNTICRWVSGREERLAQFARRHDVVIFVSGAKSSNGRVLFEAVKAANPRSHKIEDPDDLRPEWFGLGLGGKGKGFDVPSDGNFDVPYSVGICGATSTPRWLMEQVAETINSLAVKHTKI